MDWAASLVMLAIMTAIISVFSWTFVSIEVDFEGLDKRWYLVPAIVTLICVVSAVLAAGLS